MKNVTFQRFGAYLIDIILVGIIGMCFSYFSFLNPNEEQYESFAQEVVDLYESYDNNEITIAEYEEKYISLSYDLNRSNWLFTTLNMFFIVAYFVLLPIFMGGQTIGKKILKIKVIAHDNTENVSIFSYIVRAIIQNNIIITIIQLIVLFQFSKESYYPIYSNVNMVGYVLLYFIVFLILIRKDSRGLHDLIAGTKVVSALPSESLDFKITEESQDAKEESIILEEVSEKEEEEEKTVTKKKSSTAKKASSKKVLEKVENKTVKTKNTTKKKSTNSKK